MPTTTLGRTREPTEFTMKNLKLNKEVNLDFRNMFMIQKTVLGKVTINSAVSNFYPKNSESLLDLQAVERTYEFNVGNIL